MMRFALLLTLALAFAITAFAQQRIRPDGMGGWVVEDAGPCSGLYGATQGACIWEQQRMQQQQRQQQELLRQQQIESQRLQNELLRRQLQQQQSTSPQIDYSTNPELRNWQAENLWFATDRPRTEFAMLYAKQLRQERPGLVGRAFLDAVSAKVAEVFGVSE